MTPWTLTHQASLSMGFLRQANWSGLPFPSPGDLPKDETHISCIVGSFLHCRQILYHCAARETQCTLGFLPECTCLFFNIIFMKIIEMGDYKKVLKIISIVHKIRICKSSVNHRFKLFWKHFYAYFL